LAPPDYLALRFVRREVPEGWILVGFDVLGPVVVVVAAPALAACLAGRQLDTSFRRRTATSRHLGLLANCLPVYWESTRRRNYQC
jgi:hypothetical protein